VLCGTGNNAGDGYIAAAVLKSFGVNVVVNPLLGDPKTDLAKRAMENAKTAGVVFSDSSTVFDDCKTADVIVDALFGIGFQGMLPKIVIDAIEAARGKTVVSLDIPSGLNADNPIEKPCFEASLTICFEAAKPSCVIYPVKIHCGTVNVLSIGIPRDAWDEIKPYGEIMTLEQAEAHLKNRSCASHKGMHGKLLCVCGSKSYTGAAALAALSALRTGAGNVKVAAITEAASVIGSSIYEVTYLPMISSDDGCISAKNVDKILTEAENSTALLIGCGLGRGNDTTRLVLKLIEDAPCPLILDADALITPHIGEMARLIGLPVLEVLRQSPKIAAEFATKYHCVVVLKNSSTIVSLPDGKTYYYSGGHPGLAKAGSGDVLAGIIASLRAQDLSPEMSATVGVTLHGGMASRCEKRLSKRGMLPHEILDDLCAYFSEINQ
jgi:NAD(P)H-hydrate epimerase